MFTESGLGSVVVSHLVGKDWQKSKMFDISLALHDSVSAS